MSNDIIDFNTRKVVFEKRRKVKELIAMLDDDCQILMGKMSHGMNEYVSTSISSMNDIFESINDIGYDDKIYDGKNLMDKIILINKNNLFLDPNESKMTGIIMIDNEFSEVSTVFENIPFMMNVYIKKDNTGNIKINFDSMSEVKMSDISRIEIDKSAYLKDL